MKYIEIKTLETSEYNKILKECGVFWAFDKKTFVDIECGGFMPRSKIKELRERLDELDKKISTLISKYKQEEEHILYELDNYECFYTGSIAEAEKVLPYSQTDIMNVYKKNYKKRTKNL